MQKLEHGLLCQEEQEEVGCDLYVASILGAIEDGFKFIESDQGFFNAFRPPFPNYEPEIPGDGGGGGDYFSGYNQKDANENSVAMTFIGVFSSSNDTATSGLSL